MVKDLEGSNISCFVLLQLLQTFPGQMFALLELKWLLKVVTEKI
jgi:hypothetical protein